MDPWAQALLTSIGAILASSGFWAWMSSRHTKKNQSTELHNAVKKLVLVLTYDKVKDLGMAYIERGWISREEFEDYVTLYYEPYKALGGNGVAEKIFRQVSNLSFGSFPMYSEIDRKPSSVTAEFNNGR
jgi:hypothetical protein